MAQRKVNCEVYTDRGIVGKDGKSAYQQAVEGGYQGTEEEFEQALASDIATVADNVTNINAVGNNIENVNTVAGNATNINTVATNISSINTAATNIPAIIAAPTEAANAANSATAASASATIATTQAELAKGYADSIDLSNYRTSADQDIIDATLATKAELAGYLPLASKAVANGVASLDENAKIPSGQLTVATTSTLGGVKPDGTTITVTEDGTISATGGSGSGFDFEGTKAEFDAAVAAGTITDDSVSLITDDVSGDNVATKAELQDRVAKAGDTMTGPLKMSGENKIRFGTDDNFYYVKVTPSGQLAIFNKNSKGLLLQAEEEHAPFYWNGTNVFRLLTTADLANIDYVVESKLPTASDPNWYRVYKSGWVEQGGQYRTTTTQRQTWGVITFLKPFTDTNYTVQAVVHSPYRDTTFLVYMGMASIGNKTTTKVDVGAYGISDVDKNNGFDWTACGQGAN